MTGCRPRPPKATTRTLSFRHLHTTKPSPSPSSATGGYDDAALKKLDWFCATGAARNPPAMDPHLLTFCGKPIARSTAKKRSKVICGYRAPGTNAMLRARSTGVAQNSITWADRRSDFAIPGVDLEKIARSGPAPATRRRRLLSDLRGSPFVHMDTGTVRHWPRMTRDQLAKVFPDGRTVHVPVRWPAARRLCLGAGRRRAPRATSRTPCRWPRPRRPASSPPAPMAPNPSAVFWPAFLAPSLQLRRMS